MATFSLKTTQKIPISIQTAWEFFSSPENLEAITPPNIGFEILSKHHGNKLYAGQLIEYKVRPFAGIPVYWMTEITQVAEGKYFIDEQRFGPYEFWHHQHHFKKIEGGVEMVDIVHYRNPLGFLGNMANSIFIQSQLKKIFDYRFNQVEELFGRWSELQPNKVEFNKVA